MFGKSSQQKLAPYRSQSTDMTGFPTPHDTSPYRKVFPNRPKESCSIMYIYKIAYVYT